MQDQIVVESHENQTDEPPFVSTDIPTTYLYLMHTISHVSPYRRCHTPPPPNPCLALSCSLLATRTISETPMDGLRLLVLASHGKSITNHHVTRTNVVISHGHPVALPIVTLHVVFNDRNTTQPERSDITTQDTDQ
jgi:hypothetical protein